jgi:putative endonuclease
MDAGAVPAWLTYVLVSGDGARTYVGVTNDLPRRLAQHNGELPGGARSTRAGRPWRVGATHGPFDSRAEAQRVEHALKRRRGAHRLRPGA